MATCNGSNGRRALAEVFLGAGVATHAVDLVWWLGTLHCLTQQEPATSSRPGAPAGSLVP